MYHPPIMNGSTVAHDDADKILERVQQELIVVKGMKAVLCVGDQQTFSRDTAPAVASGLPVLVFQSRVIGGQVTSGD